MHLLQSVFMLIDWCDTLHFELRPAGALSREDLARPLPPDDLVLRAARALQVAAGAPHGAHIAIEKRLPAQAGMGGGSSDAATCLLALNRLWGLGLPLPALAEIGLALGADVPFFLAGRNAWVEGIGERMTPVDLPAARFAVVKPRAGPGDGVGFRRPAAEEKHRGCYNFRLCCKPVWLWPQRLAAVAQRLCPGVTQALEWLGSQGLAGRMTGSGSAVFARMPQSGPGSAPLQAAAADWLVRECGNLEAHPLVGWAPSDD